jgi:CRP/FNR family cyclic AMP-dependent transcriptional regulator
MTVDLKYWYLRTQVLFSQLNTQEICDLHILSCFKTAKKNEYIYFGGDDLDRLYFLKQGRIKIAFQNEVGEEVVCEILKENDVFGAISLQTQKNVRREYAQALSNVHLCSFTIADFEKLLENKPNLAIQYAKKIGEKINVAHNKFADIIFKDSRQRIVNFFKLHAEHEGKFQPDGTCVIDMYLTHQDIAHFTAVSRQTTTKIINELIEEEKIIYLNRKTVVIPNIVNLK